MTYSWHNNEYADGPDSEPCARCGLPYTPPPDMRGFYHRHTECLNADSEEKRQQDIDLGRRMERQKWQARVDDLEVELERARTRGPDPAQTEVQLTEARRISYAMGERTGYIKALEELAGELERNLHAAREPQMA